MEKPAFALEYQSYGGRSRGDWIAFGDPKVELTIKIPASLRAVLFFILLFPQAIAWVILK